MRNLNLLIKPASSSCNLRYKYCFYYDVADNRQIENYGIMNDITFYVDILSFVVVDVDVIKF